MTEDYELYCSRILMISTNIVLIKQKIDSFITELGSKPVAHEQIFLSAINNRSAKNTNPIIPLFKQTSLLIQNAQKSLYLKGNKLQKICKLMLSKGCVKRVGQRYQPTPKNGQLDIEFYKAFTLATAYIIYTYIELIHLIYDKDCSDITDPDRWNKKLQDYTQSPDKNVKILADLGLALVKATHGI